MKSNLEPSAQEVLSGLVERVTFHNGENGFCVLRTKARGHRDLVTVIGHAAVISAGEWITASGEWINDRAHGQQFKARFLKTSAPSSIDGIEKYLGSGMIRGIGPVYAKKMVKAFGEKVFDVIEAEPDRLREVTGIVVRAKRITDAEDRPGDHGLPAQQRGRNRPGGSHLQDLRRGRRAGDDREPLSACPRHPRDWFQERRRDRDEARHRKDRDDPAARRHILCFELSNVSPPIGRAIRGAMVYSTESGKIPPELNLSDSSLLVMSLFRDPLAAVEISRNERHSHEVGNVVRLHLLNDGGPVVFGRPRADAQVVSDELGRQPLQEKGQDLSLALCQQRLSGVEFLDFVWIIASFVGARQGFFDGDQQRLGVERLLYKIEGSRLHRQDGSWNVAVRCYHDDRRVSHRSDDVPEKFDAAHAGKLVI
jgi:hypothetical protein